MSENKVHVLGLQPRQQAALRLLLYNLYCGFLSKMLHDVQELGTKEAATIKTSIALTYFRRYHDLIDLLAKRSEIYTIKSKVITIDPAVMKQLVTAVTCFEEKDNYLDEADSLYVKTEIKDLTTKVTESAQYTYTMSEIKHMQSQGDK